jgi:flagellar protein FlaG
MTSGLAADPPAAPALPVGKVRSASGQDLPPPTDTAAAADLERLVRKLNDGADNSPRALSFRVDESSGRTVITVVDADTQRVVRQIPAEEVLALSRALTEQRALVDVRI